MEVLTVSFEEFEGVLESLFAYVTENFRSGREKCHRQAVEVASRELETGSIEVEVMKVAGQIVRTDVTFTGEWRNRDCSSVANGNVVTKCSVNITLKQFHKEKHFHHLKDSVNLNYKEIQTTNEAVSLLLNDINSLSQLCSSSC